MKPLSEKTKVVGVLWLVDQLRSQIPHNNPDLCYALMNDAAHLLEQYYNKEEALGGAKDKSSETSITEQRVPDL